VGTNKQKRKDLTIPALLLKTPVWRNHTGSKWHGLIILVQDFLNHTPQVDGYGGKEYEKHN